MSNDVVTSKVLKHFEFVGKHPSPHPDTHDFKDFLMPILTALQWSGDAKFVIQACPHFTDHFTLTDLRNTLAQIKIKSHLVRKKISIKKIDPKYLPCLLIPDFGPPLLITLNDDDSAQVYSPYDISGQNIDELKGALCTFIPEEFATENLHKANSFAWVYETFLRCKGSFVNIFLLSFLTNIFSAILPLIIMTIYDLVINRSATDTMRYFFIGILAALIFDFFSRVMRHNAVAYVAARLDQLFTNAIFRQILYLPIIYHENTSAGDQLNRIKQFDSVREYFIGPIALLFFELPYILIFWAIILLVAGYIFFIPFGLTICFFIATLAIRKKLRLQALEISHINTVQRHYNIETLNNVRLIKLFGNEHAWFVRIKKQLGKTLKNNFDIERFNNAMTFSSQLVVQIAGIAAIVWATIKAMNGEISVGGVIAVSMLIWRALTPIQTAFLTLVKFEQILDSVKQTNQLMTLPSENKEHLVAHQQKRFQGDIIFSSISLRYPNNIKPSLINVNVEIKAGEVVTIIGRNGCGKSSMLRLMLNLYQPQSGSIHIDDVDIRQYHPSILRQSIGYVPQFSQFFYGTIHQNLLLSDPSASLEEIQWALEQAGVWNKIEQLPQKINTRLGDIKSTKIPAGILQGVALARAYLRRPNIFLLDEPTSSFDAETKEQFRKKINELRGHATILIVSHDPDHMLLADRIIALQDGFVVASGPTKQVLNKLPHHFL